MRSLLPSLTLPLLLLVACGDDAPSADAAPPPDADLSADAAVPSCTSTPVSGIPTLTTETVASGFDAPVAAVIPPGETRLFVLDKVGSAFIVENGEKREPAFLNIANKIIEGGERGLLGFAFHPRYHQNRRFYVYYTQAGTGALVLEEYTAEDPNDADEASGKVLLTIDHSDAGNHNGGWLAFGPDGKLYMATGDGGGGGDGPDNAQNDDILLGKMLRLDVDTAGSYAIPDGNPFKGVAGKKEEIWSTGLRNPWRNSFDRMTGDLYIADVGQNYMEEINVEPTGTPGGRDYGWDVMEGSICFNDDMDFNTPAASCDSAGKILPVFEYKHCPEDVGTAACGQAQSASVTGGYVYRGCKMPDLHGTYFWGDVSDGYVKSFKWDGAGGVTDETTYPQFDSVVPYAFAEDYEGEMLVLDANGGVVRRLIPAP